MTKERKLEILKDLLIQLSDSANILCTCEADERCEVVEECIKALEQQPCDDCVSREQALSAIRNLYPSTPFVRMNLKKWQEENKKYFECEDIIKALSPVTPTHCIAAISFSKEDLKDICNECIEIACEHSTCMNCKHNRPNSYARTMFSCERGNRFKLRNCEDFYCADFEKRGDKNDEIN